MALGLRSARPKLTGEHATPARAALALVIAERAAAAETLARLETATGWQMTARRSEAERQVRAADTALDDAKAAAAASLAATLTGGEASASQGSQADAGPPSRPLKTHWRPHSRLRPR